MKYNPMLLAGDIGGTKTDLAIFSNEAGPHAPLVQAEVHSAEYPSLQALAKEFLTKTPMPVAGACFAVAGDRSGRIIWPLGRITLCRARLRRRSCGFCADG